MNDDTQQQKIVVIDDDNDVRWMLQRYLTKNGFDVTTCEDGKQLRELHAATPFDDTVSCVLMDIGLPGEDGLTLAKWLREEQYQGALIMLTAAAGTVDRVLGLDVGADDYVTKPFEPKQLLARIKSVLKRVELSE